ncbi:MAG: tetratricopeptide repeat protein [Myxococcota bacterium]|nr:tetratricopeptide repeat protein [Myxococcota bacterium]
MWKLKRPVVGAMVCSALVASIACSNDAATITQKTEKNDKELVLSQIPKSAQEKGTDTDAEVDELFDPFSSTGISMPVIYEVDGSVIEVKSPSFADREILAINEDDGTNYLEAGTDFFIRGKYDEAVNAFRRALDRQPQNADVWAKLGQSYLRNGQKARGAECIEQALQKDPNHAESHAVMARLFLDENNGDAALSHAASLSSLKPWAYGGYYLIGRAYSQLEMWKEAIDAFEKAIEIRPDDIHAHNNLGFAALQVGEDDMAVYAFEVATNQTQAKPYMLNNLGLAYERSGQQLAALAAYETASAMKIGYVKANLNRDRLLAVLTDDERAQYMVAFVDTVRDEETKTTEPRVDGLTDTALISKAYDAGAPTGPSAGP